ncbi:MAG: thiol-disulfide oxidoreductase DCC family protein [Sumerlaeia bacterium]
MPDVLPKPVVLYDGSCNLCVKAHDQLRALDKDETLDWLDITQESTRIKFPNVDWKRAEDEIHLVHKDGRIRTGSRAVRDITELIGGEVGQAAAKLMDIPGIKTASDAIYQLVAENRFRVFGRKEAK